MQFVMDKSETKRRSKFNVFGPIQFKLCGRDMSNLPIAQIEDNWYWIKVRKRAKIRNRYNQAPHLTQDTNGKVTTSQ